MKNPTILVVTDRNDLDGQLHATFASAKLLLRQEPTQIDSIDDLRDVLGENLLRILFTTIQKI